MKTIFIILCIFLYISTSYTQNLSVSPLDSISKKLDQLINSNTFDTLELDTKFELIRAIKEYSDHLFYSSLWESASREIDKPKKIIMLIEITLYPYYRTTIPSLNYWAHYFYINANLQLVKEYSGNLELLNTVTVDPSAMSYVYPNLKRAIEAAGGKWEKGPIVPLFHPDEIIKK
jgi:hypothetical protein